MTEDIVARATKPRHAYDPPIAESVASIKANLRQVKAAVDHAAGDVKTMKRTQRRANIAYALALALAMTIVFLFSALS